MSLLVLYACLLVAPILVLILKRTFERGFVVEKEAETTTTSASGTPDTMVKCASCDVDKPDSAFSKTQLVKGSGNARCDDCVGGGTPSVSGVSESVAPGAASTSPAKANKTCSVCGRNDVTFSKAQLKKADGKCAECVRAAEASGAADASKAQTQPAPPKPEEEKQAQPKPTSPRAADASKQPESKPESKAEPEIPKAESNQDDEDMDSIRIRCESCAVFKPPASFEGRNPFCKVCAGAKRRGSRTTTMQEHGLVGKDGASHRKLSWVPDNLREWLAHMEEEAQEAAHANHAREQAEEEAQAEYEYGYEDEDPDE